MKRIHFAEDGITVDNVSLIEVGAEPESGAIDVDDDAYVGPGMVRAGDSFAWPTPSITAADVDAERDRRIAAGFVFQGRLFQSRPEDQKRIGGAFSLALAAVVGGAQPGDLLWHQPEDRMPFAFIAEDNEAVLMDAQTTLAFGRVAAGWESAHIFAARAIKNALVDGSAIDLAAGWPG